MEWIIQKATELGVSVIIPCTSEKSITLQERDCPQPKSHRWQEIARKAATQSRRRKMPLLARCTAMCEALRAEAARGIRIETAPERKGEKERHTTLRNHSLRGIAGLTVVCEPEGGFTEGEVAMARGLNYVSISMSGRVLRCETAAIAGLSIVQFLSGDL